MLFIMLQIDSLLLQGFNLINDCGHFVILIDLRFSPFEKINLFCFRNHFARFRACCTMSFLSRASSHFTSIASPTISPSSDHVFACWIFTRTILPMASFGPLKLTSLLFQYSQQEYQGYFCFHPQLILRQPCLRIPSFFSRNFIHQCV